MAAAATATEHARDEPVGHQLLRRQAGTRQPLTPFVLSRPSSRAPEYLTLPAGALRFAARNRSHIPGEVAIASDVSVRRCGPGLWFRQIGEVLVTKRTSAKYKLD